PVGGQRKVGSGGKSLLYPQFHRKRALRLKHAVPAGGERSGRTDWIIQLIQRRRVETGRQRSVHHQMVERIRRTHFERSKCPRLGMSAESGAGGQIKPVPFVSRPCENVSGGRACVQAIVV